MYFLTFEHHGMQGIGVLTADKNEIIPLSAAEKHYRGTADLPASMLELIAQGEGALKKVQALIELTEAEQDSPVLIPLDAVRVMAPIPRPRKNIFCVGKNYKEHALELNKTAAHADAIPKHPVFFTKPPTAVIGPNDGIMSHQGVTEALDYEVELAVVIGKRGKGIAKEQAMDYIFGYMILNDITARDLQKRHLQWFLGKSLDASAPTGPYLVHKSAVPHPDSLTLTCKVNGEVRQKANTKDLIFDIPTLIATLSAGLTLEPGDIIATGTPAGVGAGFNPPRFLKPGDKVELEIGGIGILRNPVV